MMTNHTLIDYMQENYLNGYENLIEIKIHKNHSDWFGIYFTMFTKVDSKFFKVNMTEEFYIWYINHCPNKTSPSSYYDTSGYICADGMWDKDINLIQEIIKTVFKHDLFDCKYELTISKER